MRKTKEFFERQKENGEKPISFTTTIWQKSKNKSLKINPG